MPPFSFQHPNPGPFAHEHEARVLRRSPDHAVVALSIDTLAHTLIVQAVRLRIGHVVGCSVYAIYREASMTFEATVRFDCPSEAAIDSALLDCVATPDFRDAVIGPIACEVRRHFDRPHASPGQKD
jgi:hypothetical protein